MSPSLGVPSGPASINQVSWEAVKMEKLKSALPDSTEMVFNISMMTKAKEQCHLVAKTPRYREGWQKPCA